MKIVYVVHFSLKSADTLLFYGLSWDNTPLNVLR